MSAFTPPIPIRRVRSRLAFRAELIGLLKDIGNFPGDGGRWFLRQFGQVSYHLIGAGLLVMLVVLLINAVAAVQS